jgi:hypothetical protein
MVIIWGIIRGFGRGFSKFGGIFAEYFGAAYTDFCPEMHVEIEK